MVRPEAAVSPARPPTEQAFRNLVRVLGLLERVMHPYFAAFGITGSQWGVLRALQRAEESGASGLRLTDLSERLLIRPPSVTGVVDRLERDGLVVRAVVLDDLRARQVELTAKGRKRVRQVLAAHPGQIARVMSGLGEEELSTFHALLSRLGDHLDGLAAGPAPESAGAESSKHSPKRPIPGLARPR